MARYKQNNYDQLKLLPISFSRQILPGTFEYTLSHIIDHELNLSRFDARYANDETGAPAYVRPSCSRSCSMPTPAASPPAATSNSVTGQEEDVFEHTALATDSGFHTEKNVQALFEQNMGLLSKNKTENADEHSSHFLQREALLLWVAFYRLIGRLSNETAIEQ